MNEHNKKIKIIYISGIGRSGSTLLDMTLSTSDNIFSTGEIRRFNDYKKNNKDCSCGKKFRDCTFWGDFIDLNYEIRDFLDYKSYLRVINYLLNPLQKQLNLESSDNYQLFNKVKSKTSGNSFILDSSKCLARLINLEEEPNIEVYNIHLVRDPVGVVGSYNSKEGHKERKNFTLSFFKWYFLNLLIIKYTKSREMNNLFISANNFCRNTNEVINKIEGFLGIKIPRDFKKNIKEMEYHNLGGNRVSKKRNRSRFTGIKKDMKIKKISFFKKYIVLFLNYFFNFKA